MSTSSGTTVELYWRPGCIFCMLLRPSLRRSGLPVREINIWDDPAAAARVRSAAGGNETVPTVFIGAHALVNPTLRQVLATVRDHAPELARDASPTPHRWRLSRWLPLLTAGALALLWVLLAAGNPTTTYHLAPPLVAAAAPVTLRWWTGTRVGAGPRARLAAAGLALAVAITAGLAWQGWLAGPDLTGGRAAATESIILAVLGAGLGWWLARRGGS